jgi:hypothetical protein
MEIFYIAVLIIAVFFLILILTTLGILMKAKDNAVPFPPSKNTCPDYWTVAEGSQEKDAKCKPNPSINRGKLFTGSNQPIKNTKGYDATTGVINFNDAGWSGFAGKSQQCAIHDWTISNQITWDGVSNFNGC